MHFIWESKNLKYLKDIKRWNVELVSKANSEDSYSQQLLCRIYL